MSELYQDFEPGYDNNKEYLHDWFFHFNPFTCDWNAVPRDKQLEYWSNLNCENVVRSKSFPTLLEILHITRGDVSNLDTKLNVKF
jgi:hypothetical protein